LWQALGWFFWLLSLYFGFAPIFILKKWGRVKQGQSYIHTTQLVKNHLYSIVRHPQYLAGIFFSVSLILLSMHWIIFILGLIASSLIYLDIQAADQQAIEKFGEPYLEYMKTVPQVNFITGIIKKIGR
jgi:protein-S-isoprenylcysteine O-methyltransferase Ste14